METKCVGDRYLWYDEIPDDTGVIFMTDLKVGEIHKWLIIGQKFGNI